jgi:hypothetical protein
MPELSRVLGGPRRGWVPGWTIAVAALALPTFACAESVPASVRACIAETDPGRRLACYDREMARFPEPAAPVAANAPKPPAPAGKTATVKAQQGSGSSAADSSSIAGSTPTTAGSGSTTAVTTSAAAPASSSTAAAAVTPNDRPGAGDQPKAAQQDSNAAKDSRHLSAHVVSIERLPNEMVLHLDNGQVWQEVQSTSGDLSLREGDLVKIDKQLGSYWLSGPHVSAMKVRQKS